jgi:hypothetical protein
MVLEQSTVFGIKRPLHPGSFLLIHRELVLYILISNFAGYLGAPSTAHGSTSNSSFCTKGDRERGKDGGVIGEKAEYETEDCWARSEKYLAAYDISHILYSTARIESSLKAISNKDRNKIIEQFGMRFVGNVVEGFCCRPWS